MRIYPHSANEFAPTIALLNKHNESINTVLTKGGFQQATHFCFLAKETMQIAFKNNNLREFCENKKKAEAELGSDGAKKLRTRLSDLEAAENVCELIAGRPR